MKRKRFFEELMVDVFVGRDVAVGDAAGDLTVVRLILCTNEVAQFKIGRKIEQGDSEY